MRIAIATILLVLGGILPIHAEDAPVRVFLGGPRKVTATISSQDGNISVSVEMLAVRCFDAARNKQVNRDKAETFAKLALARYLQQEEKGPFSIAIRGKEVVETRLTEKTFLMVMQIPQGGIKSSRSPAVDAPNRRGLSQPAVVTLKPTSNLFTVKDDYLATLSSLCQSFVGEVPAIPREPSDEQSFFDTIAKIEEVAVASFSAIRSEVITDKLLLSDERDELLSHIDDSEDELLNLLRKQVSRLEKQAENSK